jgi:hypothetical protein
MRERCPREAYCTRQRGLGKWGFSDSASLVDEVKINRKKRRLERSKNK